MPWSRVSSRAAENALSSGFRRNDVLVANAATNELTGNRAEDTFVWMSLDDLTNDGVGFDVIADFTSALDHIDLHLIDAVVGTSGRDAFSFICDEAFTGLAQLRFAEGVLSGNVAGDTTADFSIRLTGATTLAPADLILV